MPLIAHRLGARILGQGAVLMNVTAEAVKVKVKVKANALPYPLSRLTADMGGWSGSHAGVMQEGQ